MSDKPCILGFVKGINPVECVLRHLARLHDVQPIKTGKGQVIEL
jgi:hypothetical protein